MASDRNETWQTSRPALPRLALGALGRGAVLAALWWAFSEGAAGSWLIGGPAVAAATALSLALAPPPLARLHLGGVARFVPYFLRESVLGGVDVARRALDPALPVKPGFVTVPLGALPHAARLMFLVAVSLLPGTLSARLHEDRLKVHVLDRDMDAETALARLRERIEAVFTAHGRTAP